MKREFKIIKAKFLHPSQVLPTREVEPSLLESVRRDGVQHPIIVRPSSTRKGMFEIIDGHLRFGCLDPEDQVTVDIRYDVDDEEVFRLSESTFKRKDRNTFERALFYAKWVEVVKSRYGEWGAQSRVAKESGLSEAQISQYLAIHKLFETLLEKGVKQEVFNVLKNQSINKLYELSRITDCSVLLEAADFLANNPNVSLEELKHAIERIRRKLERKEQELLDEIAEALEENSSSTLTSQQHLSIGKLEEVIEKFKSKLDVTVPRLIKLKNLDTAKNANKVQKLIKIIKRILRAFKDMEKELRGLEVQDKNFINNPSGGKEVCSEKL